MNDRTAPAYGQQCAVCGHAVEAGDVVEQVSVGGSGPTRLREAHWGCAFGMARGYCYSGGSSSCAEPGRPADLAQAAYAAVADAQAKLWAEASAALAGAALGCSSCPHATARFNGGRRATTCGKLEQLVVAYGHPPEHRPSFCPLGKLEQPDNHGVA